MYFVTDDILSGADLERAKQLARGAKYVDGRVTTRRAQSRKNNGEMEVGEDYASLTILLNGAIEASNALNRRMLPRFRTNPIINRYEDGMFYAEHIDAPIQGMATQVGRSPGQFGQGFIRTDYSMTLFLSEPDTYDGGELVLEVLDETKQVKLRAGSAVCYSTGIRHSVRPVTRGTRFAAIYWFQSMVKDLNLRRVIWEQYKLEERLSAAGQPELSEAATAIRLNLVRYLAEI